MFRRHDLGVGLLLLAALAVGCNDASGNKDITSIRVINASPNGPLITALLNGAVIEASIPYGTTQGYQLVDEDGTTIQLRDAQTNATLFNQDVSLEHERFYTEIATGFLVNIGSLFVEDAHDAPPAGTAEFRFIQVAPSMPAVDVYVTDANTDINTVAPTIVNVAFNSSSAYVQVAPATYRVRATSAGTKSVLLDVSNVALPALAIRSMLSLDKAGGGTPFSSLLLVDMN